MNFPGNTFGTSVEELAALEVWARGLPRPSILATYSSTMSFLSSCFLLKTLTRSQTCTSVRRRHCSNEPYACLYCLLHGYSDLDRQTPGMYWSSVTLLSAKQLWARPLETFETHFPPPGTNPFSKMPFRFETRCSVIDHPWNLVQSCKRLSS